jgi:hypothetical protein
MYAQVLEVAQATIMPIDAAVLSIIDQARADARRYIEVGRLVCVCDELFELPFVL